MSSINNFLQQDTEERAMTLDDKSNSMNHPKTRDFQWDLIYDPKTRAASDCELIPPFPAVFRSLMDI